MDSNDSGESVGGGEAEKWWWQQWSGNCWAVDGTHCPRGPRGGHAPKEPQVTGD